MGCLVRVALCLTVSEQTENKMSNGAYNCLLHTADKLLSPKRELQHPLAVKLLWSHLHSKRYRLFLFIGKIRTGLMFGSAAITMNSFFN